jgi:hypothetical protein
MVFHTIWVLSYMRDFNTFLQKAKSLLIAMFFPISNKAHAQANPRKG